MFLVFVKLFSCPKKLSLTNLKLKIMKKITLTIYLLALSFAAVNAQTTEPFLVEAESGTLGSDYATGTDGSITYVYPTTDLAASGSPGNDTKVITYSLTFPEADTYDLYVKLNVGAAGNNDDSFFTPRAVGSNVVDDGSYWVNINQLDVTGHTLSTDIVTGDNVGGQILEEWKWVNVSNYHATGTDWNYSVNPGALTVTFQIGARENGLLIDKLVFGKTSSSYTVAELEAATTLSAKKHNTLNSVTLYPNPSKGAFNIKSNEQSVSYKIYSILGAKIEEGVFGLGLSSYGENLKSGTYILDLQANGKRSVSKIVKL